MFISGTPPYYASFSYNVVIFYLYWRSDSVYIRVLIIFNVIVQGQTINIVCMLLFLVMETVLWSPRYWSTPYILIKCLWYIYYELNGCTYQYINHHNRSLNKCPACPLQVYAPSFKNRLGYPSILQKWPWHQKQSVKT